MSSVNASHKSGLFKQINVEKEPFGVDKLMNIVTNIVSSNNDQTLNANKVLEFNQLNKDKNKKIEKQTNDNQESRFSIKQLLEKNDNPLIHKKNFFVISDEIKDEDEDLNIKMKREILVNKLLLDKNIMHEHCFNQNFHDRISNELYLALSLEARRFLFSEQDEIAYKQIHALIGYDETSNVITNDVILNICNGFIKLSSCKKKIKFSIFRKS